MREEIEGKGMDLRTIERWLAPYLDYEPGETATPAILAGAAAGGATA